MAELSHACQSGGATQDAVEVDGEQAASLMRARDSARRRLPSFCHARTPTGCRRRRSGRRTGHRAGRGRSAGAISSVAAYSDAECPARAPVDAERASEEDAEHRVLGERARSCARIRSHVPRPVLEGSGSRRSAKMTAAHADHRKPERGVAIWPSLPDDRLAAHQGER